MSPKPTKEVIRSSFNDTGYKGVRSIEGESFIPVLYKNYAQALWRGLPMESRFYPQRASLFSQHYHLENPLARRPIRAAISQQHM